MCLNYPIGISLSSIVFFVLSLSCNVLFSPSFLAIMLQYVAFVVSFLSSFHCCGSCSCLSCFLFTTHFSFLSCVVMLLFPLLPLLITPPISLSCLVLQCSFFLVLFCVAMCSVMPLLVPPMFLCQHLVLVLCLHFFFFFSCFHVATCSIMLLFTPPLSPCPL